MSGDKVLANWQELQRQDFIVDSGSDQVMFYEQRPGLKRTVPLHQEV